ncbi:MAG: cytochrome c [Verrucomicrobiales bacterium]|nr:cytochrome c [Verrucomicrobiales bacterium]
MTSPDLFSILARTPVPRDLELPLPLPEPVLTVLLVLLFLLHIFFVNLMVGGTILVTFFEILGLRRPRWDELGYEIAKTVTVNKSLAVVLGIGPLLCINLLYTIQWYSANALTGHAWLLIIPLVTIAFLLAYLHKYTWHRWNTGRWKQLHLTIGLISLLLFLAIPVIFLANVNLMHFPSEWAKVKGFFSSLEPGNVFPRYVHFLLASIAIASLFMVGWFGRKSYPIERLEGFTRPGLKRLFLKGTAFPTAAQFIAGPLLLFTLPKVGITTSLYQVILAGASVGLLVTWLLFREIRKSDDHVGNRYIPICFLFSLVVLGMGSGRQIYRQAALSEHKQEIADRTASYESALAEFRATHEATDTEANSKPAGETLFANCAACHAPEIQLVGPSLAEIAEIYAGNPEGIVAWAKAPGKKRPQLPPMPPFNHLGDEALHSIAVFMLEKAGK